MNSRLSSLILLLHIQGSLTLDSFPVQCNTQNICAVRGTQVTLSCSYSDINIKTVFWFNKKQKTNWRENDEAEDLTLDSDYSGRVKQWITEHQSDLIVIDVRERDSGEYQLMFIMKDGVKHINSVSVNLTVTVLQVKMIPESTGQQVKLICDSSCKLTSGYFYDWYKNGQKIQYYTSKDMLVSSRENTDSYSCSEYSKNNPSTSVCVSNSGCWGVTYTSRRVCALVGSTVDINSTYSHPAGYTVVTTYWHLANSKLMDLHEDQRFAGRVEYVGNTLRIKDVKMSNSGEYQFRFITNTSDGMFSGSPGVILTVTDTQVKSSPDPVIEGEKVILSCLTRCTLDNKHTYIWYKNGTQVTDGFTLLNKLYLNSASREEIQQYSCAVTESYPEKRTWLRNTSVILSVFLTLALIGVLWYRIRKYNLSESHKDAKTEAQYESVYSNIAPSEHTHKEENKDNQDIHYSSINFKTKHTSVDPRDTTEKEDVQYATVMFS